MAHSEEELAEIFDSNDGYCCYCSKKLTFDNYDRFGKRGNWNVAHVIPQRYGLEDEMPILSWLFSLKFSNCLPACISCNAGDQKGRLWLSKIAKWFAGRTCPKCHKCNSINAHHCVKCGTWLF